MDREKERDIVGGAEIEWGGVGFFGLVLLFVLNHKQ